jgi:hypothetical protein
VLAAVLESPAGLRSTEKLAPFQLAIGVPRGVEKLIHVCRAAYASGWIVGRNDFANGFNSLCRQKMVDANCAQFPESTDVFNFFYGMDSPILLFDDNCNITVLNSSEGPRQGCAAGSHSFALTIHPLLAELQSKYPEFEIRVLTDDIIPLVPPPLDPTGWQPLYLRYGCFLRDLQELASKHAGLQLNMDKCGLLLPHSAPEPDADVRAAFPTMFDFRTDGFRVAGSPIGTDRFVNQFIEAKLLESLHKLNAIKQIGTRSPRAAHRLISTCATKLLSFLAATVPPTAMLPVLSTFDEHVQATFLHVLAPAGFECSEDRMERAKLKASLPFPLGCGLFKAADQGAIAWWASVSNCLSDPLLFKLRNGLGGYVSDAWKYAIHTLGGSTSKFWTQAKPLFPPNAAGLLDGSLYAPTHAVPKIRLCKDFLRLCTRRRIESYQELTAAVHLSPSFNKADVIHANTRTFVGCVFAEPMSTSLPFTFTNEAYISWCCFFLGLPPVNTIGNHTHSEHFDYPVQKCQALHSGASPF